MTLAGPTKKWRPAREIINWEIEGRSIFGRKKPLSPNTLRRIMAGLRKFSGPDLEPFIVKMYGTSNAGSIDDPVPTITGVPKVGLCKPFLVEFYGNGKPRPVDLPVPTITTKDRMGVAEPFVLRIGYAGGGDNLVRSIDEPVPTILSQQELAICEPFILPNEGYFRGNIPKSLDDPLGTVTSRGGGALIKPFIIPNFGERDGQQPRVHSVDEPLPTVTSHGAGAVVEPFILGQQSGAVARSVDEPAPTISTAGAIGLVMPEVDGYRLDIKFRMLTPEELAKAMSFQEGYFFAGKREEVVKQIGNAVPVNLAKELCKMLLPTTEKRMSENPSKRTNDTEDV
jgi:DNA (cytosine-5)-methyltransferase 1